MLTRNFYIMGLAPNTVGNSSAASNDATIDLRFTLLRNINGEQCVIPSGYGEVAGGSTTFNYSSPFYYCETHAKVEKSALVLDTAYVKSTSSPYGVVFGNGTTPETVNDCNMAGELFSTYTHSQTLTCEYDETGVTTTIRYTLTNTSETDFTISEVGIFGYAYVKKNGSSYYFRYNILLERTVLETPVTIPGNGGVGQVTYTFRMDFPT